MRILYLAVILFALLVEPSQASSLPRGFIGINLGTWDSDIDNPQIAKLLKEAGIDALRYPGGSTADDFDWTKPQATSTALVAHLGAEIDATMTFTVNFGSGTPQMAAAWVAYCNSNPSTHVKIGMDRTGRDWKDSGYWARIRSAQPLKIDDGYNRLRCGRLKPLNIANWEIGNEDYGRWEHDQHSPQHDPALYAKFAVETIRLIKEIDPSVHVGVIVATQFDPTVSQESVIDPIAGKPTSDWNSVVLSALSHHNICPDFLAFHHYPEQPFQENDHILVNDAKNWRFIVSDLRRVAKSFYGIKSHTIKLSCTECGTVTFNPGPQSISKASSDYYHLAATAALANGVNCLIWWDLHNGRNFRTGEADFGDYGILGSDYRRDIPYPVYYAIKAFHMTHLR